MRTTISIIPAARKLPAGFPVTASSFFFFFFLHLEAKALPFFFFFFFLHFALATNWLSEHPAGPTTASRFPAGTPSVASIEATLVTTWVQSGFCATRV